MPARPSKEEILFVTAEIARDAIQAAAGDQLAMRRFAHDWFPDHDAIDWREIGQQLSEQLMQFSYVVRARRVRLEQTGKARCPGGKSL
jgi:hypothetical protein